MVSGKLHLVTVNHKPTKHEVESIISELVQKKAPSRLSSMITFEDAAAEYIEMKSNILSPSTIREYEHKVTRLPEEFRSIRLSDIDEITLQKLVNDYSGSHSPKYVKDVSSFITSVVKTYNPGTTFSIKLPQAKKKDIYIPTKEDVQRLLQALKGTEYEIPVMLACMGLRRSEICALTMDDLDLETNTLTINKAMVIDRNQKMAIKAPKTTDSTRTIVLPQNIVAAIVAKGYIYNGYIENIGRNLSRYQKKLGMHPFSLHKLRHFFASYMHGTFTDKQIQAAGGWKTDTVLKTVYQHEMDMEQAKQGMADKIGDLF